MSEQPQPRQCVFSPCRKYRYTLWRTWDVEYGEGTRGEVQPRYLMVIGLNPSTADETQDDPTIRRCIGFAKAWNFGALCMTNLFAWRDTLPENMKKAENPAGQDNHHHLLKCASEAGLVLAAWGTHGSHRNQDLTTRQWLNSIGVPLYCLGVTKNGHPKHPLYIKADTQPVPFL